MKRTLIAIIAIVATAFAADTEFSVPVIGYVFDSASKQIRPLTGTPGAAVAGRGISIEGAETVLVARDGAFALVSSAMQIRCRLFGARDLRRNRLASRAFLQFSMPEP